MNCDAGDQDSPLTNFEELPTACMIAHRNVDYESICFIAVKQIKCVVSGYMDKWLPWLGKQG